MGSEVLTDVRGRLLRPRGYEAAVGVWRSRSVGHPQDISLWSGRQLSKRRCVHIGQQGQVLGGEAGPSGLRRSAGLAGSSFCVISFQTEIYPRYRFAKVERAPAELGAAGWIGAGAAATTRAPKNFVASTGAVQWLPLPVKRRRVRTAKLGRGRSGTAAAGAKRRSMRGPISGCAHEKGSGDCGSRPGRLPGAMGFYVGRQRKRWFGKFYGLPNAVASCSRDALRE
ncbi:hypothetical protein N9L68_00200 [bacterium]|nr:hypothetical protein [bacterium]